MHDSDIRLYQPWTPQEDFIALHCATLADAHALLSHRTVHAIASRAHNLGGRKHRRIRTSQETWDRAAKLLAQGKGIKYVASLKGMPTAGSIKTKLLTNTDFAARSGTAVNSLVDTFDPAVADRVIEALENGSPIWKIAGKNGLPRRTTIFRWKHRHPEFAKRIEAASPTPVGHRFVESEVRCILEALSEGCTIKDITIRGRPRYILSKSTLKDWRRRSEHFDTLVARAVSRNAKKRKRPGRKGSAADSGGDWLERVRAAVPRYLSDDARNEVVSLMALAIVERHLAVRDIEKRMKEFVAIYYRSNSKFGPESLDAPVEGSENLRLVDVVTKGLWES